MMAFRRFRPDPFEACQRGLQSRLRKVENQLLLKFPPGEQRQLMRRTVRQLLQREQSLAGKIKRLMQVAEQEGWCEDGEMTNCSQIGTISLKEASKTQKKKKDSQLFSPIPASSHNNSHGYFQFQKNPRFCTQNEEDSRYNELPSRNSPFSRLASMQASSAIDNSEPQLKKGHSAINLYDSINQRDIFSFRTQKQEQSPIIDQSKKSKRIEQTPKIMKKTSKSRSKKSSIEYSQQSSKSKPNHSRSKSRKRLNYDGISQSYIPSHRPSSPNLQKSRKSLNKKQLFQKIFNRLKYSSCVIGNIRHSNTPATALALQNRFLLEKQGRTMLAEEITRRCEVRQKWKC